MFFPFNVYFLLRQHECCVHVSCIVKHACLRGLGLTLAEMDSILHQVCKGHTETTKLAADEDRETEKSSKKCRLFAFVYIIYIIYRYICLFVICIYIFIHIHGSSLAGTYLEPFSWVFANSLGLPRNPASNWCQSSPTHPFVASGSTTKSKIQRELSKLGTEVAELADSISCHQEIESPSQKSSTFFFNF